MTFLSAVSAKKLLQLIQTSGQIIIALDEQSISINSLGFNRPCVDVVFVKALLSSKYYVVIYNLLYYKTMFGLGFGCV